MNSRKFFPSSKSLMSRPAIQEALRAGEITIDSFNPANLGTDHYDVTLGPYFYRMVAPDHLSDLEDVLGSKVYNFYDEANVQGVWTLTNAKTHKFLIDKFEWSAPLANIDLNDRIILIQPKELILAHTQEFIGGSCSSITTKMFARSTSGRNGLEICADAGKGDVGYFNRWTMEIYNRSEFAVPLVVGRRYAQIAFYRVDHLSEHDSDYSASGKYQTSSSLARLKENWKPEDMLPKKWLDREVELLKGEIFNITPHSARGPGPSGSG